MHNTFRFLVVGLAMLSAAFIAGVPQAVQQPPAAGSPTEAPSKEDPLRFTAFNVSLERGMAGVTEISIERWTTADERTMLLGLVGAAGPGQGGQRKLLHALQKIKPRTGFIRTPNSLGWDLRYAVETTMDDGSRQIVIATDKPVSFAAAAINADSMDYPFTLIEMRMKANEKGEGRMLTATAITVKNGRLELENYGQEPVRLTSIEEKKKNH